MAGLFTKPSLAEKYSKLGLAASASPAQSASATSVSSSGLSSKLSSLPRPVRSRSKTPPQSNVNANKNIAPTGSQGEATTIQQGCMRIPAKYINNGDGFGSTIVGNRFPNAGGGSEFREVVENEIIIRPDLDSTSFDDVVGHEKAKQLLNEAVVLPLIIPEFFQAGLQEPWKGVLLFGPPGTGKTMLARSVANMNGITFFNCSASALVNKYRGESEKMLRCVFEMARERGPSIVFFDEIDSVMGTRGGARGEKEGGSGGKMSDEGMDESSRRLITELLKQIDGIESGGSGGSCGGGGDGGSNEVDVGGSQVLFVGATNMPWSLDEALRRRLEKRIYIGLPDESAREKIMRKNFADVFVDDAVHFRELAEKTEGLSGSDLKVLCREAAMAPLRRLLDGMSVETIVEMNERGELEEDSVPCITRQDVESAVANVGSSVSTKDIEQCLEWNSEYGSQ